MRSHYSCLKPLFYTQLCWCVLGHSNIYGKILYQICSPLSYWDPRRPVGTTPLVYHHCSYWNWHFFGPNPPIAKAHHLFFHSELVSVAQSMVSMANPGSWLKFDTQNLSKKRPLKKNLRLLGGAWDVMSGYIPIIVMGSIPTYGGWFQSCTH